MKAGVKNIVKTNTLRGYVIINEIISTNTDIYLQHYWIAVDDMFSKHKNKQKPKYGQ